MLFELLYFFVCLFWGFYAVSQQLKYYPRSSFVRCFFVCFCNMIFCPVCIIVETLKTFYKLADEEIKNK